MNELEKKIDCLQLKEQGIRLEYQYVNELKDKRSYLLKEEIKKELKEKELLKSNIQELEKKLANKNQKIKEIESSRWWKVRNFIKKENLKWKKNKKK